MNDCHRDTKLDALIGEYVKVTFRRGKPETGILQPPREDNFFRGMYWLKQEYTDGYYFHKSHVKKIEVI